MGCSKESQTSMVHRLDDPMVITMYLDQPKEHLKVLLTCLGPSMG